MTTSPTRYGTVRNSDGAIVARFCPVAMAANPTPHSGHQNADGSRCIGVPERDDRARTFDPKGGTR